MRHFLCRVSTLAVLTAIGPSCVWRHRVIVQPMPRRIILEAEIPDHVEICVRLPFQADLPYPDAGLSCAPLGDLRRWLSAQRKAN